jgi:dienelactone hydrolase
MTSLAGAVLILIGCADNETSRDPQGQPKEVLLMNNDARAREFVDLLVKKQFADAVARFDGKMKQALPVDKLQPTWQSLLEIVYITCKFEKATLDAKVVFDREHLISGLFFVPSQSASSESDTWTAPPYAKKEMFEEKEIKIGSGEWQLPGTLTLPMGAGPFPAVVLVHGSGPHDRDETIGPNKPFRDLAWGLASKGIAVVRYDKRTKVHAAKLAGVRDLTVQQEVIDDAVAAATAARTTARIDPKRVFVLGHSLGGYLAPRILLADDRIAGAVVLAGSTRPMEDLIVEQMDYISKIDGTVSKEEAAKIDEIKADLAKLKAPSFSASSPPVFGVPASYWIDLRKYDPVAAAKTVNRPMLILQGGRDYQVTRADFSLWEKGLESRKNVSLHLYPDLNHLFITGAGKSTPEEYGKDGQHVALDVVDDIAKWISDLPSR